MLSGVLKRPLTIPSRAKRGIFFLFIFNENQQMLRCAQHDKTPFFSG